MNILILSEPNEKFVSCGQSQDVNTEIDIDFCQKNKIGYTRRIAGGTTVYLDENQVFYNVLIYGHDFPTPTRLLYKKSLGGPLNFLRSIGIDADLNHSNEITVKNRKISGIGSCSLENVGIVVGNIILDFDYESCVNTLSFPSTNFKELFKTQLENSVSSIKRELQKEMRKDEIYDGLITAFENDLGIKLVEDKLTNWEIRKNKELEELYQTDIWLNTRSRKSKTRRTFIKVKKDSFVFHFSQLKADFVVENKIIKEVRYETNSSWLQDLKGLHIKNIPDQNKILRDIKEDLHKHQILAEN